MNHDFKAIARALAVGGLLWTVGIAGAFQQEQRPPAPDNTKVNKRDRSAAEPTSDQAKETVSDRNIMQKIRKALVADKTLSTYGKNVKIISRHGKVTLKGPVHTEDESKSIEAKAVEVAGAGNVTNQLAIKGDHK
jgi:osmotically-inducible protein OsmY